MSSLLLRKPKAAAWDRLTGAQRSKRTTSFRHTTTDPFRSNTRRAIMDQSQRRGNSAPNVLAELESHGAACVSNLMLVHPYSTRDTIRAAIDHLASIESGIVETTRMMVYHGTRLHSELEQAGRISGNPLRYGYTLQDPVAQRFSEAFAPLRLRVFGDHSLAQVMHGVAMTLTLARRLHADRQLEAIQAECRAMERTVRSFTVNCLHRVFHVVYSAASTDSTMRTLFAELAETSRLLRRRADQLDDDISHALRIQQQRFAPTRAAATSMLALGGL